MQLWYTEPHTKNVNFSIAINKHLASKKSYYQRIDVFESNEFGRILTLDGYLMVTEKDEFIYHEMIVHVPMATNLNIKNVLVIGAGDGGTIRELTRYDSIESITMVEIDEEVVNICREYLPQTASKLDDKRVKIVFEDGLKYVRNIKNEFDLIIIDSTDPFGPGEGLFTKEFYGNCYKALTDSGIMINQHESPYYKDDANNMQRAHRLISGVFPVSTVYQLHIPTYPSGHWLFGYASKGIDPIKNLQADSWNELGIKTNYYNTELHIGSFMLPNYVKELLNKSE